MKLIYISILALFLASCTASYTSINNPPPPATLGPNSVTVSGTAYEKLGERQTSCRESKDQPALIIPDQYRDTVTDLVEQDKLKRFTFKKNQNCLRVGTEVFLEFDQGEKKYIGRVFVTSIVVGSNTTVNFDTQERIFTTNVTQNSSRLPSCGSRGDWTAFYIGEDNIDEKIEKLKNGFFTASIVNGGLSCYRTGSKSYVKSKRSDKEKRGHIIPKSLHIMHMSELTQTEADLVNMSLADLIQSLQENKAYDGGYVNIVIFDYVPPEE